MTHYSRHLTLSQAWSRSGFYGTAAVALGKLGQRQPRFTKRLVVKVLQTIAVRSLFHLASLTHEDREFDRLHRLVCNALAAGVEEEGR